MNQENTQFEPVLTMAHLDDFSAGARPDDSGPELAAPAWWFDEAVRIRGLWALCQIEHAIERVINPAYVADPEAPSDEWFSLWFEMWSSAHLLGYETYPETVVPKMISAVPELRRHFLSGVVDASEIEEMIFCPYCQDDTGNPCPEHG